MNITLTPDDVAQIRVGLSYLNDADWLHEVLGQAESRRRRRRTDHGDHTIAIDCRLLVLSQLRQLRDILKATSIKLPRGEASMLVAYIAVLGGTQPRATGACQMSSLMEAHVARDADLFRIAWVKQGRVVLGVVERVVFHPEYNVRQEHRPASMEMRVRYTRRGNHVDDTLRYDQSDCRGMTPAALLATTGHRLATADDNQAHDEEFQRYVDLYDKVGLQCLANGRGLGGRGSRGEISMAANGDAAVVVIDTDNDDDEDVSNVVDGSRRHVVRSNSLMMIRHQAQDEDDEDAVEGFDDPGHPSQTLPVHPFITCFDLRRHNHFSVHVSDLSVYEYDTTLGDKLVLDQQVKWLIGQLSNQRGQHFRDVVSGKSGGMTMLLAGPPGVGKTLTAEIYAEAVGRPLYRVQCSQLGIEADKLEEALLSVFRRANRWKAIILLDESDVYISRRGDDLAKNAIVGVFLRVLEYQENAMFLTTNLPESVDDAVASRCIVRIDYTYPSPEELGRIWRVLADSSGISVTDDVIEDLVDRFPFLSGRDVKNLLKLVNARQAGVDIDSVSDAARFLPSRGNWVTK